MGVVKGIRAVGRATGRVLDAEDRLVLGQILVWSLGLVIAAIVLAAAAGLAVRVFQASAGG